MDFSSTWSIWEWGVICDLYESLKLGQPHLLHDLKSETHCSCTSVKINQLSSMMDRLTISVMQMMETQGHLVAWLRSGGEQRNQQERYQGGQTRSKQQWNSYEQLNSNQWNNRGNPNRHQGHQQGGCKSCGEHDHLRYECVHRNKQHYKCDKPGDIARACMSK